MEKETERAKKSSIDLEKKAKVQENRLEQARLRMDKIEAEDKERCQKTAAILKEFEKNSCNGPFFKSLLEILTNFQGKFKILNTTLK